MYWNNQFVFPSSVFEPIYRIGTQAERINEKKAVLMDPVGSTTAFTQAPGIKPPEHSSTLPKAFAQSISNKSAGVLAAQQLMPMTAPVLYYVMKNIEVGTEGPSPSDGVYHLLSFIRAWVSWN